MKTPSWLSRVSAAGLILALGFTSAIGGPRGRSVNRRVNINSHSRVDIDREVHRDIDVDIDLHHRHHPIGFGAGFVAGAVTGAVVGAAVAVLPRGYRTIYVGGVSYAYHGGVFYQTSGSGYVIVAPPVGAIISELPPGATVAVVRGGSYYLAGGVYYQPVLMGGITQYRVIRF